MIPKILHRMWLNKLDPGRQDFPKQYNEHMKTFHG